MQLIWVGQGESFFRLFAVETLDSSYFQGGGCKVFCSNVHGVQVSAPTVTKCYNLSLLVLTNEQRGDYRTIGAYAAMSMVQGGPGLPIFANAVLVYFSSGTVTRVQIEVDNLPLHLKSLFEQVY